MIMQMQPKGLNMFNDGLLSSNVGTLNAGGQGSKYVDKYPVMDEQCRKDLPLQQQTADSRRQFGTASPHKSVRFSEGAEKQPSLT